MKKLILLLVIPILIAGYLTSCKKDIINPENNSNDIFKSMQKSDKNDSWEPNDNENYSDDCNSCNYQTRAYSLLGNQSISVGTLFVTNDANNLYVTYKSSNGWSFSSLSLYVGNIQNVPLNGYNPNVLLFPYQKVFNVPKLNYKFTIPLSQLSNCYVISSNAISVLQDNNGIIIQTVNTWSTGMSSLDSRIFWTYNNYCTQVCQSDD